MRESAEKIVREAVDRLNQAVSDPVSGVHREGTEYGDLRIADAEHLWASTLLSDADASNNREHIQRVVASICARLKDEIYTAAAGGKLAAVGGGPLVHAVMHNGEALQQDTHFPGYFVVIISSYFYKVTDSDAEVPKCCAGG